MSQITFATGGLTVMTTSKQHDFLNRLTAIASPPGGTPSAASVSLAYTCDSLGRCIRQTTSDGGSGTWQVTEDLKLVSAPVLFGRHIAELNATNNALVRSFVWGLDLSGALDGAGGVGGLLSVNSAAHGTHFCASDVNGNIMALIAASDGSETARYEYGPFGEPLRLTGPMAKENPFRFSTKRTDDTTDLVLYEYRLYNPSTGRWLNRDPIGERGSSNVYGFAANRGPNAIDFLGLCKVGDKRNVKCRPHASSWVSNPDLDATKDALVELAGDLETLELILQVISVAGGAPRGLTELVEEILKALAEHGSRPDAEALAKALNELLNQGHGNWGGWYLWTRIEYEECQSCLLGLTSRWKTMPPTPWKEYRKGGEDGRGLFTTRIDAYRAARKACDEHLREFEKGASSE